MNGVQGPSRLLNHSRFPNGRAHGFAAPLRVALGLWPKCPQGTRFPSRLAGVWGRLPVAQSSRRALAAPTARFAPHLRVALRCAQQPTGLTLPSGAPSPVPQHKKASVASARRAQETRPRSTPPRISAQTARPSSTRRGRAASIQKTLSLERPAFLASLRSLATLDGLCRRKRRRPPASSCIKPRFLLPSVARNARRALPPEALASLLRLPCIKPRFSRPFGRSQRSTGFAAGSAAVLRLFLHQAAFLASRLLNHSRFP